MEPNSQQQTNFAERKKKKILILLIVLFLSLCVFLLLLWCYLQFSGSKDEKKAPERSLKTDNARVASMILENIKLTIDPCDDFAEFACGTAYAKIAVKSDKKTEGMDQRLVAVIKRKPAESLPEYFQLPHRLFKKCMANENLSDFNILQYVKVLKDLDIPFLSEGDWNQNNTWNWQSAIRILRKWGHEFNYIITLNNTSDNLDITTGLQIASTSINTELFPDKEKFISVMRRLLDDIVPDKSLLLKDLEDTWNLRRDLIDLRDRNLHYTFLGRRIGQLQRDYGFINFLDYINALLPKGVIVDENFIIKSRVLGYLNGLGALLERHGNRTIANHIACAVIEDCIKFLPHEVYSEVVKLSAITALQKEDKCVDHVRRFLQPLLLALFEQQKKVVDNRKAALRLVEKLRESTKKLVNGSEWLDPRAREVMKLKLDELFLEVARTDEMVSRELLSALYGHVDHKDTYLGMHLQLYKRFMDRKYSKLHKDITTYDLLIFKNVDAFEERQYFKVNTVYSHIYFPLGILERHFYTGAPGYVNFGTFAWHLGGAFMHDIDDYSKNPVSKRYKVPWNAEAKQFYGEQAQCLTDYFHRLQAKFEDVPANTMRTFRNLKTANGGLAITYTAYTQWRLHNGPEPPLPGLEKFTENQMFWVCAAQPYCSKLYEGRREMVKLNDETYAPEVFLNGVFQNNINFSKDFNCSPDKKMNPEHKCEFFR